MKIFATRPKLFMSMLLATKIGLSPAAAAFMRAPCLAVLRHELAVARELQDVRVGPPLPPIHTKPL